MGEAVHEAMRTGIEELLRSQLGGQWSARSLELSGFCATWEARGSGGRFFVKSVADSRRAVLQAEADGLLALAATGTIRVPAVQGCWTGEAATALALEWLDFASPDRDFGSRFGTALAALHCAAPARGEGRFGWDRDNLIGATPQSNDWSARTGRDGWLQFFSSQRLMPMRRFLAQRHSPAGTLEAIDAVAAALPELLAFDGHEPRASLIHGDLWSGNWGMLADGTPVVFDPAVSCSDAEAELAMMELFGAPPAGFWPTYRAAAGLDPGYARRRDLYQLYHLLNHAVLFGGGYLQQAMFVVRRLTGR